MIAKSSTETLRNPGHNFTYMTTYAGQRSKYATLTRGEVMSKEKQFSGRPTLEAKLHRASITSWIVIATAIVAWGSFCVYAIAVR